MQLHELSYAKIIILREDIAEVIINEGIEIDEYTVNNYHEFLIKHLNAPFSLLINKINAYTYDFQAQLNLGTIPEINAMAVVSYNRVTTMSTEMLAKTIPRKTQWNMQIFSDREQALSWLITEQMSYS